MLLSNGQSNEKKKVIIYIDQNAGPGRMNIFLGNFIP